MNNSDDNAALQEHIKAMWLRQQTQLRRLMMGSQNTSEEGDSVLQAQLASHSLDGSSASAAESMAIQQQHALAAASAMASASTRGNLYGLNNAATPLALPHQSSLGVSEGVFSGLLANQFERQQFQRHDGVASIDPQRWGAGWEGDRQTQLQHQGLLGALQQPHDGIESMSLMHQLAPADQQGLSLIEKLQQQQQLIDQQQQYLLLQQLLGANSSTGGPAINAGVQQNLSNWHEKAIETLTRIPPSTAIGGGGGLSFPSETRNIGSIDLDEKVDSMMMKTEPHKKKKNMSKPKRPLSAYNIFFKEERARILRSLPDGRKQKEEGEATVEDIFYRGEETKEKGDKKKSDGEAVAPAALLGTSAKSRRERKKSPHGKISFESLARQIGHNWKHLSPERMSKYKKLADVDMKRYKEEMEKYTLKVQAENDEEFGAM